MLAVSVCVNVQKMETLLSQLKQRNMEGTDKVLSSSLSALNVFPTNKAKADGVPGSVLGTAG